MLAEFGGSNSVARVSRFQRECGGSIPSSRYGLKF